MFLSFRLSPFLACRGRFLWLIGEEETKEGFLSWVESGAERGAMGWKGGEAGIFTRREAKEHVLLGT